MGLGGIVDVLDLTFLIIIPNSLQQLRGLSHSGIILFQKAQSHTSTVLFAAYLESLALRAESTLLPKDGSSVGL